MYWTLFSCCFCSRFLLSCFLPFVTPRLKRHIRSRNTKSIKCRMVKMPRRSTMPTLLNATFWYGRYKRMGKLSSPFLLLYLSFFTLAWLPCATHSFWHYLWLPCATCILWPYTLIKHIFTYWQCTVSREGHEAHIHMQNQLIRHL